MIRVTILRSLILTTALCSSRGVAADTPPEVQAVSSPSEDKAALSKTHAGEVALISVAGAVSHQDKPLTDAGELPARATLKLKSGAAAFALLPGKAGANPLLAVAMTGESTVELRGPEAQVTLLRGNDIALSGAGTLLLRGWRVELEGSLLLHDFVVYVTHGKAKINGRAQPEHKTKTQDAPRDVQLPLLRQLLSGGAAPPPQVRSSHLVMAGQAARLELGGGITEAAGEPPASRGEIWSALGAPPAWTPEVGTVNPGAVERAQQLTRAQLQAQRETASCGCTESSGSGGPAVNTGAHVTPVERTAAPVRVRIIGMPRRIE